MQELCFFPAPVLLEEKDNKTSYFTPACKGMLDLWYTGRK